MNTETMNAPMRYATSKIEPTKATSRIALVISTFGAGGAERVMSIMANYWVEHGHEVRLITLASVQEDFYSLHPGVDRVGFGLTVNSHQSRASGVKNNLRRLSRLRQEIRAFQPDVVLSFIDTMNVLTLAATFGLRVPVIVSEHTEAKHYSIGSLWVGLQYLFYPQAAAVVVLTNSARSWSERFVRRDVVHVIPNPVSVSAVGHEGGSQKTGPGGKIVAMGRLSPEKRFDLLLEAFARCATKYADWSLVILGEGDERSRLEALARELRIENQVSLPGRLQDPTTVLRKADLFVLASRFEAFPMALMEAMACGLAVISTDCDSGPREIIRNGVDGVLIPPNDLDALVFSMDRLMADEAERRRLGANAVKIIERFGVERIMSVWDELLEHAGRVSNIGVSQSSMSASVRGSAV